MDIRLEAQPDRKRLAAALRRSMRRVLLAVRVSGVVLALVALAYLLMDRPVGAAAHLVGGVFIFWALPPMLVALSVRASWRLHGIPTTWEFTDEGVHAHNELSDSTIKWAALDEVESIPGQLIFKINRWQVFPVPTADLTPEQERELTTFLVNRGLLPAAGGASVSARA